jgi:enamine deaminase RidA (YjgF/YER057c/UK114 family)
MSRHLISTGSPFEAAYGYSRAVVDGDMIFVSGTTGYDYVTMEMPEDAGAQARNIFTTIARVLGEAGFALADIVRAQYFVTDRAFCEPVLAICGEVLGGVRPAAGIYVVSGLLKPEMKVEIEVTARRGGGLPAEAAPSGGSWQPSPSSGQGGSA